MNHQPVLISSLTLIFQVDDPGNPRNLKVVALSMGLESPMAISNAVFLLSWLVCIYYNIYNLCIYIHTYHKYNIYISYIYISSIYIYIIYYIYHLYVYIYHIYIPYISISLCINIIIYIYLSSIHIYIY